MHHVKRVLASVLMLLVVFGCALSVSAESKQPDDKWFEEHLLTELPRRRGCYFRIRPPGGA